MNQCDLLDRRKKTHRSKKYRRCEGNGYVLNVHPTTQATLEVKEFARLLFVVLLKPVS